MRQILDFNENWWFIHADVDVSEARPGEGELVSLPHTWNALDGQKGDGTYDRGSYWYVKMLDKWEPSAKYSRLFLEIPAAGQQAKVFVNGEFVVSHEGGYDMKVTVAYIPKDRVIGLSKIARIADMVSKRLQLQERIGSDIADIIQMVTGTDDVAVLIEGCHSCMTARGIRKADTKTYTQTLRGRFNNESNGFIQWWNR